MRFPGPGGDAQENGIEPALAADEDIGRRTIRTELANRLKNVDNISSRMIRGAAFTASSALISRLLTLTAGIIAARALGVAQFGAFSFCQSTASVAAAVTGMGLPWAATRMIAAHRVSNPARTYQLWRILVGLCMSSVVIVSVVALFAAIHLTRTIFGSGAEPALFVASVWLFTGYTVNSFSQAVLMGTEQFAISARWGIARASATALGLLVGVQIGGPVHAIAGYALGEYVVLVPMFWNGYMLLRVPHTASEPQVEPHTSGGVFKLAVAAWGSNLAIQPSLWYSQILLTRIPDGYAALGAFSLAQRAVQAVALLPGSIALSSVPILTGCWAEERRNDFSRAARRYAAGYLAYVVPVTFIAGGTAPLTLRVFGKGYASAWPVFAVLVIAAVPMVLNNLLSTMAMASNRSTLWLFSDFSQAVALVSAATFMIPLLGAVGASLSYLTASVVTCLVLAPVARELRGRS
jgi:O-antigen/teichoic acid export membrane protein